jgi:hypothetical protein
VRVVDPDGVEWEVTREWFRRPDWVPDSPDPGEDILEEAVDRLHWSTWFTESWWGWALALFAGLIVAVVFFVLLPLAIAFVGLMLAFAVFGARLLSISAWTVTARSSRARLEWRVRGTLRSGRAVREVATGLERGDEWPLVDGGPPAVEWLEADDAGTLLGRRA